MHCHFHNPVSIHSGPGMRRQIGALAAKYGKKALIVTTGSAHSRALAEEAGASLEAAGLGWAHYNGIRPNPLGSMAAEGAQAARDNGCDMVIGIGGGSVMDASKGIAFAYYNDAPIFEYIYGRKQGGQALPILLIAGDADPVGNYGAGVRTVWAMLGDAGVNDLTCQIFEGGRHELHNETNRDEVFDYVLTWIEDHI